MKTLSLLIGPLHLVLTSTALLTSLGPAHAADSGASAPGVAKLLAKADRPMPVSEAVAGNGRPSVTALRGENLDRVMRRVLPKLPFNDEFMRKAFVQVNPDLLSSNPGRTLPAGTAVVVPTPQDLAQLLMAQYPALAQRPQAQAGHDGTATPPRSPDSENGSTRRTWVRYP
jgi:hypothetical protein